MRRAWPLWIYRLVIATYPRRFRKEYAAEMRMVFNDLLLDIPPRDLALRVLQDLSGGIHSFSGGIALALLTGLIAAASVLGDYVLFHLLPFHNVYDFAMSMAMVASFCLVPAGLGAGLARLTDIRSRAIRSASAFARALRTAA